MTRGLFAIAKGERHEATRRKKERRLTANAYKLSDAAFKRTRAELLSYICKINAAIKAKRAEITAATRAGRSTAYIRRIDDQIDELYFCCKKIERQRNSMRPPIDPGFSDFN